MTRGLVYVMMAMSLYGLSFVSPLHVPTFASIELALGRGFVYGTWSLLIWQVSRQALPWRHWRWAMAFAFTGYVGYFALLILSLRLLGAALGTLVGGLLPIAVSIYGNYLDRSFSFSSLAWPLALIFAGITMTHFDYFDTIGEQGPAQMLIGLAAALAAVAFWTWFAVQNGRFLRRNPDVNAGEWSTFMGIGCLLLTIVMAGITYFIARDELRVLASDCSSAEYLRLAIVCLIVGIGSTWVTTVLWNRASVLLPMALQGQMVVFEILFGLLYIFMTEGRLPSTNEFIGIACVVSGLLLSFRLMKSETQAH